MPCVWNTWYFESIFIYFKYRSFSKHWWRIDNGRLRSNENLTSLPVFHSIHSQGNAFYQSDDEEAVRTQRHTQYIKTDIETERRMQRHTRLSLGLSLWSPARPHPNSRSSSNTDVNFLLEQWSAFELVRPHLHLFIQRQTPQNRNGQCWHSLRDQRGYLEKDWVPRNISFPLFYFSWWLFIWMFRKRVSDEKLFGQLSRRLSTSLSRRVHR